MGESRTTLLEQNERLTSAFRILTESYQLALTTLVTLQHKYLRSKEVKNVFNRYTLMREMIKVNVLYTKILSILNEIYGHIQHIEDDNKSAKMLSVPIATKSIVNNSKEKLIDTNQVKNNRRHHHRHHHHHHSRYQGLFHQDQNTILDKCSKCNKRVRNTYCSNILAGNKSHKKDFKTKLIFVENIYSCP